MGAEHGLQPRWTCSSDPGPDSDKQPSYSLWSTCCFAAPSPFPLLVRTPRPDFRPQEPTLTWGWKPLPGALGLEPSSATTRGETHQLTSLGLP